MSFDEGLTSNEDFRAKFAAAMNETGIGIEVLCRRAGVDRAAAMDAMSRGTNGLPGTLPILSRLLQVLGVDEAWLLSPIDVRPQSSWKERRRALRALVWDFFLRQEVPKHRRKPFLEFCLSLLDARPKHTMAIATRPAVPRTTLEVAYLYDRMVKQGDFERGEQ